MSSWREGRRARTVDEIVDTALAVMTESGAAGLSLGEIAKRMGLRTPSLYVYFPSKAALCDEIFARGWQALRDHLAPELGVRPGTSLAAQVERVMTAFVDWVLEHPGQAQLMFWRPIAGWEPSSPAYAPAVAVTQDLAAELESARTAGLISRSADIAEMSQLLTILTTGVISQQLSNEPGVALPSGSYTAHLPRIAAMFAATYGTDRPRKK